MIDSDHSVQKLEPIQVVHGQYCAPLIFIAKESEALTFSRRVVSYQIDVDDLAVLTEHADHVSFSQLERQTSHENPSGIFIFLMPGVFRARQPHLELTLI